MPVLTPEEQRSSASKRCSLEKVFNQILTMSSTNTHQPKNVLKCFDAFEEEEEEENSKTHSCYFSVVF